MTREEQIKEAASKYFDDYIEGLKGEVLTVDETFEDGAKWADENPKETNGKELVYVANQTAERTKKEMIDKACEWLNEELYNDVAEPNHYYLTEIKSKTYSLKEDFIFMFRKAMEG